MIECPGFHCQCNEEHCPNPHDETCTKHHRNKPLKCSIKKFEAIDYSPIYEIYIGEPIKIGTVLRFDPASGVLEIKK